MIQCNQRDGDKAWEGLKGQVARLAQMQGFPREPAAIRELVLALQHARDLDTAAVVVSAFLENAISDTRCPMPSEIRRACYATQDEARPDPDCSRCGGDGWKIVERAGISGADRCDCWAPRPKPKWERDPVTEPGGERAKREDTPRSVADLVGREHA